MESLKSWAKDNPILAVIAGAILVSVLYHLF